MPPRSGAAGRILAELESRADIDDEDYERAMKLLALQRPDPTHKRDVTRKAVDDADDEVGETLPEDEFGEIAETQEGRQGLKSGPISEMRRLVNAFLGLGALDIADDDELDPLADHIKNANTVDRPASDEGNAEDDEGGNGSDSRNDNVRSAQKQAALPKVSMKVANARADKLVSHVDETCRALARPSVDPMNLESAIRIHLLINVFLSRCAPVGKKATVRQPILARELPRSWIRILGRLIIALESSLERTAAKTNWVELDEECVDALATILFCAGLVLDAARYSEMQPNIIGQLEAANVSLLGSARKILEENLAADAAVKQKLPILKVKHKLVPNKKEQIAL